MTDTLNSANSNFKIIHGDCIEKMQELVNEGVLVDSIVTDPPYHLQSIVARFAKTSINDDNKTGERGFDRSDGYARLSRGFMGKAWDGGDIANRVETWKLAYDVLKPGGYLLAFGGTRTFHRMTCAIEDAGFEIRDCLIWLYGSGMPKSHNISKAIDNKLGATRKIIGTRKLTGKERVLKGGNYNNSYDSKTITESIDLTEPSTKEAIQWDGWGTGLKPAWEPIIFARKPLEEKTIAENVMKYGTGGININDCRIESDNDDDEGRWPANVLLDDSEEVEESFGDNGSASRFFYSSKSSSSDRIYTCTKCDQSIFKEQFKSHKHNEDNFNHIITHPTCKPISLMRYLVRLVTPPNGTVLDPFSGSGTTLQAAIEERFSCIGIEKEDEYIKNIKFRLDHTKRPTKSLF